jgi:hypothetical protein
MQFKNIINNLKFLLILILLDFIITYFIFSKFNIVEVFYPNNDHRVSNKFYHHSFKANVNTIDVWGNYKYKFVTNDLGFKDKKNRIINKKTKSKKRILVNGDSFVEGIGIEYENTFVGLLDDYLFNKNIEILNAGVASQSPILYYKKIFYLLEEKKLEFDELILFLDISDIPDEYFYSKNYNINEIEIKNFRDKLQDYLINNSTIYLFFDVIFGKLNYFKEYMIIKKQVANFINTDISNITKSDINKYKSINVKRGNWTHNDKLWNDYASEGRQLAEKHLNMLNLLLQKYNIKFSLVIYPWPKQIYIQNQSSLHEVFWENWSNQNGVNFINLYEDFQSTNRDKLMDQYFIPGDVHWNKNGHKFIYDLMINYYFIDE